MAWGRGKGRRGLDLGDWRLDISLYGIFSPCSYSSEENLISLCLIIVINQLVYLISVCLIYTEVFFFCILLEMVWVFSEFCM